MCVLICVCMDMRRQFAEVCIFLLLSDSWGMELRSLGLAAITFSHRAISLTPKFFESKDDAGLLIEPVSPGLSSVVESWRPASPWVGS